MARDPRLAERRGREPVLCAVRTLRRAPMQPLRLDRLLAGGALGGRMFDRRPGLLRRLWRRIGQMEGIP